jgi:hypothetical protein
VSAVIPCDYREPRMSMSSATFVSFISPRVLGWPRGVYSRVGPISCQISAKQDVSSSSLKRNRLTKDDKGHMSNLDRRTTCQPGYAINLSRRWLIEKGFGWLNQTGPLRQVNLRVLEKVDWLFVFGCAAHNLIRLPRLMAQPLEVLREKCA